MFLKEQWTVLLLLLLLLLLLQLFSRYGRGGQTTDLNIIRRMRIVSWITKATDTHSECVTLIASPQQHRLRHRRSTLRYTHIACLIFQIKYRYSEIRTQGRAGLLSPRSDYALNWTTWVSTPGGCKYSSVISKAQIVCGVHPASYLMCDGRALPRVKWLGCEFVHLL